MILAGDVGGTKVNIGLFDDTKASADGRDAPALIREATFASADYDGLIAVVSEFLADSPDGAPPVRAACFGVAGPVIDNRCETPNLPWTIDGAELSSTFGIGSVTLLNDLVATAQGIPALLDDELHTLQAGESPSEPAPRALIAAGTGLGMTIIAPCGDSWLPLASEGGHVEFAPRSREEIELLRFMTRLYPRHLSIERLISGPGLQAIYDFVVDSGEYAADPSVAEAVREGDGDPSRAISQAGMEGTCAASRHALELFVSLYGAAAGNLALIALARSGVFLGGGIAPKIRSKLAEGGFLTAFRAKGRFSELMSEIPVQIILNQRAALLGAARYAARQVDASG